MTEKLAKVAFESNANGARLEGEFVADTGIAWMVKPAGRPIQVLQKSEWTSVAPSTSKPNFDDIFDMFKGGRR
ncbi:hypothetical protein ACI7YT_12640 [Microbacterium sp. M]|uniref:hypothetical protein n=1 Tax=Microbacterium sp. M TaxID=3377125 RepID=UPI00386447BE